MKDKNYFVNINDVGKALLDYIGSEEFEKAVDIAAGDVRGAFMSGIGMAGCLILANCPKYIEKEAEVSKEPIVCKSYHAEKNFLGKIGVCYGTKEMDPCSCGGDKNKCDYYGDKQ